MIYALLHLNITRDDQYVICEAIRDRDPVTIANSAGREEIVHIMDAPERTKLYCPFCRLPVFPTKLRGPGGVQGQNPWHFQHSSGTGDGPDECIGWKRYDSDATGIENPRNHGCYIQLGFEHTAAGAPTQNHRTCCRTLGIVIGARANTVEIGASHSLR